MKKGLYVKDISKKISGKEILKNINIEIQPGKITAVFGPSGSGKTTMLRNIALLDMPDQGEIDVDKLSALPEGDSSDDADCDSCVI